MTRSRLARCPNQVTGLSFAKLKAIVKVFIVQSQIKVYSVILVKECTLVETILKPIRLSLGLKFMTFSISRIFFFHFA